MGAFIYVDNSNVWLEGRRVSAVAKGLAPDILSAMTDKILDPDWAYDFGHLYDLACGDEKIGRSALFGSRPPRNDSLWSRAEREGFEVIVHDRNAANREKKVDVHIATMILDDSYQYMKSGRDWAVLVAGDGDYVPMIESLQRRNLAVNVMFWSHASRELRELADKFIVLDPHLDFLALR